MILRPHSPGSASSVRARRAATLVEFAIIAPVFFLIVLGIIELGRILMVQHLMTNAARQACRVGVLSGTSNSTITSTALSVLSSQGVSSSSATVQVNDG